MTFHFAPRTDGILIGSDDPATGTLEMPAPGGMTRNPTANANIVEDIGAIQQYVGNTSCVNANTINYSQMAGTD